MWEVLSLRFTLTSVASEPHLPHVLVENGDMTLEEYDEYLRGRGDFIKATKKDSSNERKVSQAAPAKERLNADEVINMSYLAHFYT